MRDHLPYSWEPISPIPGSVTNFSLGPTGRTMTLLNSTTRYGRRWRKASTEISAKVQRSIVQGHPREWKNSSIRSISGSCTGPFRPMPIAWVIGEPLPANMAIPPANASATAAESTVFTASAMVATLAASAISIRYVNRKSAVESTPDVLYLTELKRPVFMQVSTVACIRESAIDAGTKRVRTTRKPGYHNIRDRLPSLAIARHWHIPKMCRPVIQPERNLNEEKIAIHGVS